MNFLGIEAFLAIIRMQSISRAANELHSAQSTISHRLKILEQEIGATLIERGKGIKEIRLTPTGEEFVGIAEKWSSILRETQRLQAHGPKLSLSIGTVDSLNTCVLPQLYRSLNHNLPQMSLEIRTQHSVELYQEVDKRQVDIAFVLRERTLPNVNVEQCFTKPMVVLRLATPENARLKLIQLSELDPHHELYISWGPIYQAWHDKWWDPLCPSRIKLDSFHLIFSLFQTPLQWSIVPMWVANKALKQGNFSIHRLSPSPPDAVCFKITHKYPTTGTLQSLNFLNHYLDLHQQTNFDCNPSCPVNT